MDELVGGISQRQLVLLMRGWKKLAEEMYGEIEEHYEEGFSGGEALVTGNTGWIEDVLSKRGIVLVSREEG